MATEDDTRYLDLLRGGIATDRRIDYVRSIAPKLARDDALYEKGIALVLTAVIVLGLVVATSPAAAVVTTLAGDEEVAQDDVVTLEATIEIEQDERVPIEGHLLTLTDESGDQVEVVFPFEGEPLHVHSDSSTIDEHALHPHLKVTDVTAEFGYGYLVGYDRAVGYERVFEPGYGYGFGYDEVPSEITYEITLNAAAFELGSYDAQVEVITEELDDVDAYEPPADTKPSEDLETAFASNVHTFEVVEPEHVVDENEEHDNVVEEEEEPTVIVVENVNVSVTVEEVIIEDVTAEEVVVEEVVVEEVITEKVTEERPTVPPEEEPKEPVDEEPPEEEPPEEEPPKEEKPPEEEPHEEEKPPEEEPHEEEKPPEEEPHEEEKPPEEEPHEEDLAEPVTVTVTPEEPVEAKPPGETIQAHVVEDESSSETGDRTDE